MSQPNTSDRHVAVELSALIARYNWGIDTRDADLVASTFAVDGVFDGTQEVFTGHDQLRGFVAAMADRPRAQGLQHWVTNTVVLEDDGSVLHAKSYMIGVRQGTQPGIALMGHYDDIVCRVADDLVFQRRTFRLWSDLITARISEKEGSR